MMPIWDEEWVYTSYGELLRISIADKDPKIAAFESAARARLAAAAPAMARLLLSLEWDGDRGIDLCPACGNGKPWLAFDDQDGEPKGGHAPDCRWLAVMRAAGVRE